MNSAQSKALTPILEIIKVPACHPQMLGTQHHAIGHMETYR